MQNSVPGLVLACRCWYGTFVEDNVEAGGPPWGIARLRGVHGLCREVHPPAVSRHGDQVNGGRL